MPLGLLAEQLPFGTLVVAGAAWQTIQACALICKDLPLQPAERLRLLGTARVLYGMGRLTLGSMTAAARQEAQAGPQRTLLLSSLCAQLHASDLLTGIALKDGSGSGKLEAAFSRTTAKPAALLPWLAAITEALQLVGCDRDAGDGEQPSRPHTAGATALGGT